MDIDTLQQLVNKIDDIRSLLDLIGAPMSNGVNTLNSKIETIKEKIKTDDYTYTNFYPIVDETQKKHYSEKELEDLESSFKQFKDSLPNYIKQLDFNILQEFNVLFDKDDFTDQWNILNTENKNTLLFFDESIYKTLRKKLNSNDFNFLFEDYEEFNSVENIYPEIKSWLNIENNKIDFYKLRKENQNGQHADFFNSDKTKIAETQNNYLRKEIAINYMKEKSVSFEKNWSSMLELVNSTNAPCHYTYHFFSKLEDEYTGYDKIKKDYICPEIIKPWLAQNYNMDEAQKQSNLYREETKNLDYRNNENEIKNIYDKYPLLKEVQQLSRGLTKEKFVDLKENCKGTEWEEFFNNSLVEKSYTNMPYKREEMFFIFFREKIMQNNSKKLKL